jgi:hypothetical protein
MHYKLKVSGFDCVQWFLSRWAIYGGFWVRVLKLGFWTSRNCQPSAMLQSTYVCKLMSIAFTYSILCLFMVIVTAVEGYCGACHHRAWACIVYDALHSVPTRLPSYIVTWYMICQTFRAGIWTWIYISMLKHFYLLDLVKICINHATKPPTVHSRFKP